MSGTRPLVLSLFVQSSAMVPVFFTGSLYPFIAVDIPLAPDRLGMMVATFFAASALASASLAPRVDRLDPWTVCRYGLVCLVIALSCLAFAISPIWIVCAMVVAGLANGCIQPATNVAIARFVKQSRQGVAFGLKQSAIPSATLLAGVAVPTLALTLGWRAGYGAAAMLVFCLMLFLPRSASAKMPRGMQAVTSAPSRIDLLLVSALAGMGAGSANAMAAFVIVYGVSIGVAPAAAGLVVAFGSALSIVIRLALGAAADRFALPLFATVALLLAGGAVGYGLLASGPPQAIYFLAVILGFSLGWGWAGLSLLGVVRASGAAAGQASGTMQAGLFCGAVIGPVGFGWLVAHHSYAAAWMALAAATLMAALISMIVHVRTR